MFMDNDDEISSNSFEKIFSYIEEYHPDIIRFNRRRIQIFDDGTEKSDIFGCKNICDTGEIKIFTRKDFFENYKMMRDSGCFAGIWNGAFKRELFSDVKFDTSITAGGEDTLVNIQLYELFETILFVPDVLYTYYRRAVHSISTKYEDNHFMANNKCADTEKKLILSNGLAIDAYYHSALMYLSGSVKVMIHKNSPLKYSDKVKILDEFRKEDCFNINIRSLMLSKSSFPEKVYLLLFLIRCNAVFLLASKVIFRLRGNI